VKAVSGKDTATTHISVLNAGPRDIAIQQIRFQAVSRDSGITVISFQPTVAAAGGATWVQITLLGLQHLSGEPLDGQLVLTSSDMPIARAISIVPAPQPWTNWPQAFIFASVAVAGFVALAVMLWAVLAGNFTKLGGPAPGKNWSFAGWLGPMVAVGTIFTTVLGTATLPTAPSQISKDSLVQLNLLFVLVLAAAPYIVQTIRRPNLDAVHEKYDLWGYSPVLLVSYAIASGAVVGELLTLALLGWEVTGGGSAGWIAVGAAVVMAALGVWYFVVTAYEQVSKDWAADARTSEAAAGEAQPVTIADKPLEVHCV
jgi:hypothetical protein